MQTKSVCFVIPCYNPPEGWEARLSERYNAVLAACVDLGLEFSLCLTNDGSITNVDFATFRRIFPMAQFLSYPVNKGKGSALRKGVKASNADFYIITDVDFPYTTESMRAVLLALKERGGIAAGNRDASYYKNVPFVRMLISKTLRWMLKFFLRLPVSDSQCGLKGFDNAGKAVFVETTIDRFLFDLEFLMQAHNRVDVYPVPVELRPGIVFSKMGFHVLQREGRNFLKLFFKKKVFRR